MTWFFAVLVVLALGGIAVVAAGHGSLPAVRDDRPDVPLPDGPLAARDLRRVRFPLAVRGYRMAEVDTLLSRLADQLEAATAPATAQATAQATDETTDGTTDGTTGQGPAEAYDVPPGGARGDDRVD